MDGEKKAGGLLHRSLAFFFPSLGLSGIDRVSSCERGGKGGFEVPFGFFFKECPT